MCRGLSSDDLPPENVITNSYPLLLGRHGGVLVDLCKSLASSASNTSSKEELTKISKGLKNAIAKLSKDLKSPGTDPKRFLGVSKELLQALDDFMQHLNSPKFVTQPAKIGDNGVLASKDIVKYGEEIVDRSSSMIGSVKALVVNPRDHPT